MRRTEKHNSEIHSFIYLFVSFILFILLNGLLFKCCSMNANQIHPQHSAKMTHHFFVSLIQTLIQPHFLNLMSHLQTQNWSHEVLVELDSRRSHLQTTNRSHLIFLQYSAYAFTTNCICEIPCMSTRWVRSLNCPRTKQ